MADRMRGRIANLIPICVVVIAAASAGATSMSGKGADGSCRVVAGEKLLSHSGGSVALCAEVERAIAAAAPSARYSAEVKVFPRSRLSATLVVNGRTLPEQKFAVMDSELSSSAIHRFARGLGAEVAKAMKP